MKRRTIGGTHVRLGYHRGVWRVRCEIDGQVKVIDAITRFSALECGRTWLRHRMATERREQLRFLNQLWRTNAPST